MFLTELDKACEQLGLFYLRFMDDILILAPTRWTLRAAVKVVNQVLASLGCQCFPITSAVAAGPAVRVRLRAGSWMNLRTARSLFTSSHARHTLWRGGVPASPPAALIGHVHPSSPS